jgi:hypothetical protein
MKINKLIVFSILLLGLASSSYAQRGNVTKEDIDKFRAWKVSFITEKLQLTPSEAQKFWPIYNLAEKEDWDNQNKRRGIEFKVRFDKGNISDKELIELSKQLVETYKTEGLIREKYNKKYLEVLPPRKVLTLYQTEQDFMRHMINNADSFRTRGF